MSFVSIDDSPRPLCRPWWAQLSLGAWPGLGGRCAVSKSHLCPQQQRAVLAMGRKVGYSGIWSNLSSGNPFFGPTMVMG